MSCSTSDLSTLLENESRQELSRKMKKGRSAQNLSTSSIRKKSDISIVSQVHYEFLRGLLANFQQVILGTRLWILFLAIPLAIISHNLNFGNAWVFALSLLGLTPLAERVSFLTEQIAFYTGPTVGGLLNATCGNATELIIAIFGLIQRKLDVVKYSLLGSILSNLLLVLGSSLLCGGIANIQKEQNFDRRQADVNSILLLLGLLCHALPLMLFPYAAGSSESFTSDDDAARLLLSRICCIFMIFAYFGYLFFQLWTHRQLFGTQQEGDGNEETDEAPVIGIWSGFIWLIGMTALIAFLSEYVVGTIEDASESWGLSVSFISVILLPIVGNAAEHAGAIIFAFKNKLDITLGVALGSATQIEVFVIPLTTIVAWIIGLPMDLDFGLLGIASLTFAILVTAFTLQDGTSHYIKGLVLLLCYLVIASSFFIYNGPLSFKSMTNLRITSSRGAAPKV